ncbi:MAG: glycosyltransferase family A protein [Lachnospiraceae bacterium]|nr:glycosyltransferase family A protein [Lachnospiraceae bacterium]
MDMTNANPTFSIILPLSADAPSPAETVTSVLRQTFKAFELLLVTDGSEIPGLSSVLEQTKDDSRVRALSARSEGLFKNRQIYDTVSPVAAINTGLFAARGDYILFAESGDVLLPQALQTIYSKAIGPRQPDTVVIGFLTSSSDRTDLSFTYPSGFYSRETLEKGVFPYMICDRRKKFYSASPYPAAFNRVISRKLLLRHYCREVRIFRQTAHSFIHECLFYSESAYFIGDPLYIRTLLPWGNSYAADYFTGNMHLMNYLTERLGNEPVLAEQLPFLKAQLLLEAVRNTANSPAPSGDKAEHMEREIRDTFALSDINISALPPGPRFELSLLKGGHYRTVLALAEMQNSLQSAKGKIE